MSNLESYGRYVNLTKSFIHQSMTVPDFKIFEEFNIEVFATRNELIRGMMFEMRAILYGANPFEQNIIEYHDVVTHHFDNVEVPDTWWDHLKLTARQGKSRILRFIFWRLTPKPVKYRSFSPRVETKRIPAKVHRTTYVCPHIRTADNRQCVTFCVPNASDYDHFSLNGDVKTVQQKHIFFQYFSSIVSQYAELRKKVDVPYGFHTDEEINLIMRMDNLMKSFGMTK
jgi:hypothetical protein